jgi:hypothetical protein
MNQSFKSDLMKKNKTTLFMQTFPPLFMLNLITLSNTWIKGKKKLLT